MTPYFILPRFADGEESIDFVLAADQERARQRQIALLYFNAGPSISNLYNAASAYLKSLPFIGTSPADMNPYIQTGTAPTPSGGPKNWAEIQKVLAARKAATAAKTVKAVKKPRKGVYDGLTEEEILAKRAKLSAIGKLGGTKSGEMRSQGLITQPKKHSVLRLNEVQGMKLSQKDAAILNQNSKPSMYSKPGRIYNNGAITANDLDW